ncbi:MAG: hypothetical protein H6655_20695 [Ardenticatenaceae bacterium]|nr:hypothetical protein [Ardenticatenaceae bacterium]
MAIPMPELGAGFYRDEQGGLYPSGLNTPPTSYLNELNTMANQLAQEEELVVLGLGMSMMQNAMSGFTPFTNAADINTALTVINGAIGSNQQRWQNPNSPVWNRGLEQLAAADLGPGDVDVILYHNAWSGPSLPFPEHPEMVKDSFAITMDIIAQLYPNVQIIYLNSRHYGGWNPNSKAPEPWAYEEGWAVKWLIEERINGEIDTPLLAWMAYQWDSTWPESYFVADGLHLSNEGKAASGALWDAHFRTSSYIAPWYLGQPIITPTPTAVPTNSPTPTPTPTAVPTGTVKAQSLKNSKL